MWWRFSQVGSGKQGRTPHRLASLLLRGYLYDVGRHGDALLVWYEPDLLRPLVFRGSQREWAAPRHSERGGLRRGSGNLQSAGAAGGNVIMF